MGEIEIKVLAPGAVILGPMQLVATKELVADADSITFDGLNGDDDGLYLLEYSILQGVAALISYQIQPNGITANQTYLSTSIGGAGAVWGPYASASYLEFAISGGLVGALITGRTRMDPKTGKARFGNSEDVEFDGTKAYLTEHAFVWDDSATVITSLVLAASVPGAYKAGTKVSLYKILQ